MGIDVGSVVQAITDPAVACTGDGAVLCWNAQFADRFERRHGRRPVAGEPFAVPGSGTPTQLQAARERLARAAAGSSGDATDTYGEWTLRTTYAPLRDRTGAVAAVLFVVRFLSSTEAAMAQRDAALAEARAAAEIAERANRAKSVFLSRMSHELRTPLNAVLGFGQILETEVLGESRQHVGHIIDAGQHLLGLIDEILDLARLEAGHISVTPQPVDAREVLQDVAVLLAPVAVEAGVAITVPADADAVWVNADPQRLKQVVINLVGNAIKYGASGAACTLTIDRHADAVAIAVTDAGPGIPSDQHERLFAPFDRLDAETGAIPGSGLGLALSRGLTEAMDGTLTVESEVGRGTRCTVTLRPVAAPTAVPEPGSRRRERLRSAATEGVVLYIEDDPSNVRLVESILGRRPGVRLAVATDGPIGLRLAQQARPDLVLLDMHLPGEDGEQVLASLRADRRTADLPVAVVSADATPDRIARLEGAGVLAYLTKPLDVARFLEVVDDALGRPAALRVLVADDAPIGRQIAERLLVAAGHDVRTVADGREAVEAVRQERFDLVLLDQEMPRLNGIDAAAEIRAGDPSGHPRLLLLTAHDAQDLPATLASSGIERVLTKPLTRQTVTGLTAGVVQDDAA